MNAPRLAYGRLLAMSGCLLFWGGLGFLMFGGM